jgi:outer membrane protein assembly complex protein YaeT
MVNEPMTMTARVGIVAILLAALAAAAPLPCVLADDPVAEARVVDVVIEGNHRIDANEILAQMKLRAGSVYTPAVSNDDLKSIYKLHEFQNVVIEPKPIEGGVRLIVHVVELPVLDKVEFVNAKHFSEKKLLEKTHLAAGLALDRQQIFDAVKTIQDDYKKDGYYFVSIDLDRALLDKSAVARFTITEGPKVTVRKIRYVGNDSLSAGDAGKDITTHERFWPFISGEFSEENLDADVEKVKSNYTAQGFLDVQVARRVEFGPNHEKVTVVFVVREGRRYQVASVALTGVAALDPDYLKQNLKLRPGKPYVLDALKADEKYLQDAYGRVGYVHCHVDTRMQFTGEPGQVAVFFDVREGLKITVGEITITGNRLTQDKVILRALNLQPEDVADATAVKKAQDRLMQSQLFSQADISFIPTSDPNVENLLVNVEEKPTTQFIIGAGVSSNEGLIGNVSLVQKNFDIARWPTSWDDPGAFRGAGQTAHLTAQPGTETSQYNMGWSDPNFLDRDLRLDATPLSYFKREWDVDGSTSYDESRLGGQAALTKNLTREVSTTFGLKAEDVDITNIQPWTPTDVLKVEGRSVLTTANLRLQRDTTDNYFAPTTGSRAGVGVEQADALGGDYDFTKFFLDGKRFWTVTEDVLGRRSVFSLRGQTALATTNTPIFERFYAGGEGSMRGFAFRGVGPTQLDQPIGGDFLLVGTSEYEFPLYGRNLRGVVFFDAGDVEKDISIGTVRASAGFGLRLVLDVFGAPIPIALDFGFPLHKAAGDQTQIVSFSIAMNM